LNKVKGNNKKNIVLLSTGAYCPVHKMHVDIFVKAKKILEDPPLASGIMSVNVVAGYLSPTHDSYVSSKVESSKVRSISGIHRLEMIKLNVQDSEWMDASSWEVDQYEFIDYPFVYKHFKKELESKFNVEIWYLCGSDHALKCHLYDRSIRCVAVSRPTQNKIADLNKMYDKNSFIFIQDDTEDMSSTKVRNVMRKKYANDDDYKKNLELYLHPNVAKYIIQNNISIKK